MACLWQDHYLIELDVTHHSGQVDPHSVAYLAGQPWEWNGNSGVGKIIDNGSVATKGITAEERADVALARGVFDSLFPYAASVRVRCVWRL